MLIENRLLAHLLSLQSLLVSCMHVLQVLSWLHRDPALRTLRGVAFFNQHCECTERRKRCVPSLRISRSIWLLADILLLLIGASPLILILFCIFVISILAITILSIVIHFGIVVQLGQVSLP